MNLRKWLREIENFFGCFFDFIIGLLEGYCLFCFWSYFRKMWVVLEGWVGVRKFWELSRVGERLNNW